MRYLLCSDLASFNSILSRIDIALGYPDKVRHIIDYALIDPALIDPSINPTDLYKNNAGTYAFPVADDVIQYLTVEEIAALIDFPTALSQGFFVVPTDS